jgi:hypothetical protein
MIWNFLKGKAASGLKRAASWNSDEGNKENVSAMFPAKKSLLTKKPVYRCQLN